MPTCNPITTGLSLANCNRSIGGVETVYIALTSNVSAIGTTGTLGATSSANAVQVNSITMVGSAKFYKFELERELSNFTNPLVANNPNGTVYFDEILTLIFNNPDALVYNQIAILSKNAITAVVKLRNGEWVILGSENDGLIANGGEAASGVAAGDSNRRAIQFRGFSETPAKHLNSTAQALFTGGSLVG